MLTYLLLGLGFLIGCQKPASIDQTYAVVVGIADYQALSLANGDLRYADQDAQQVVSFLQSKSGGSVPSSHIRLLTNRQASLRNIQQALTLFQQAGPADRVIFYFSGHGLPDSFVPYDARPNNSSKMITHHDTKAAFRSSKAGTKLCIADACLSGSMTKQQIKIRNMVQTTARNLSGGNNVAMMLASRSTQRAIEDRRLAGGTFTYFMLRGLTGEGDFDGDHIVTIRELYRYVTANVKRATHSRQTPVFYGRFSDNLALSYL
jgi:uncharacterized caspase-like protein